MKRKAIVFIMMIFLLFVSACGKAGAGSGSQSTDSNTLSAALSNSQLENKMTELERSRVEKHGLTLLDDPEAVEVSDLILDPGNHTVSVEYYQPMDEGSLTTELVLVDGKLEMYSIPGEDYNGGEYSFMYSGINDEGEYVEQELTFATFEEYLDWIREDSMKNYGYSEGKAELSAQRVRIAYEAIKSGNYEVLPKGTIDFSDQSLYDTGEDEYADYRNTWEYDRDAVEKIKDSIDEINIYDEELDVEFLVHVTLPPDYDKDKTYPVFFLTDGVWRFGNHSELRKVMEEGEAADVILVSLGYNYHMNGTDETNRYLHLVQARSSLLNFITDNLMPYLGENYKIDYANSTLYGHSDGGVFTHHALFNSDQYENQPFGYYIIGSPAFWCLYDKEIELDPEGCETDYGYFDRNERLDKHVFLCGGALEDPDYQDSYNGHATTLEGLENLKERLESHGSDVTYKLYDSHHYQFIPEMLIEYLKETYPKR